MVTDRGSSFEQDASNEKFHALALMKALCAYFWILVGRIEGKKGANSGWPAVKEPLDDSISFLAKIPPVKLKCRRESIRHSLHFGFLSGLRCVILRAAYKGFVMAGDRKWSNTRGWKRIEITLSGRKVARVWNFVRLKRKRNTYRKFI